jgi:pimeloyl-ACP methyl ester carboxylesterase
MPLINNQGIRINYEVVGNGFPIVLNHGLFQKGESWYLNNFVQQFSPSYKLIMIDSRGNGKSDKPIGNEYYSFAKRAEDTLLVLKNENINHCHYIGFSMGGKTAFTLMGSKDNIFKSFTILSSTSRSINSDWVLEVLKDFPFSFPFNPENPVPAEWKREFLRTDKKVWLSSSSNTNWIDNSEFLTQCNIPVLFIFGSLESDDFKNNILETKNMLKISQYKEIPNYTHDDIFFKYSKVIPIIMDFYKSLGKQ